MIKNKKADAELSHEQLLTHILWIIFLIIALGAISYLIFKFITS